MMLQIFLSKNSKKFLRKCEKEVSFRILKKIKNLAQEPFPSDTKRVVGKKEKVFRIRIGGYRILYVVYYNKNEILISDIDKRPRAYR